MFVGYHIYKTREEAQKAEVEMVHDTLVMFSDVAPNIIHIAGREANDDKSISGRLSIVFSPSKMEDFVSYLAAIVMMKKKVLFVIGDSIIDLDLEQILVSAITDGAETEAEVAIRMQMFEHMDKDEVNKRLLGLSANHVRDMLKDMMGHNEDAESEDAE